MTLTEFITDPETNKVKWGAWSRVSEYTGLSITSLKRYIADPGTLSLQSIQKVQDCIHARIDLSPQKMGAKTVEEREAIKDDLADALQTAARLAKTERELRSHLKTLQKKIPRSYTL